MTERISEFVVSVGGDGSGLLDALEKLKGGVRSTVADLERTTSQVELFKGAQKRLEETNAEFVKLERAASLLRQQITFLELEGGDVGVELTDSLKAVEKQVAATSKEYNRQASELAKLEKSLTKAGVDVKNLATEEARLATATKAAVQAQAEQQARATLGIKSAKEQQDAIAKLRAAYDTLRTSGTASSKELADASGALARRTRELQGDQGGLVESFKAFRVQAIAVAASLAGVVAVLQQAVALAREFEVGVARLGTVSTASKAEIRALGEGVRQLSGTLGFDLQEGLKAAYDLLRQGVPAGNILEVLAASDGAAKAAVTDIGTAAKLAGVLMRGFGLEVKDVQGALDAFFVASQNGGATFEELAGNLGQLAPLAKALKIPFAEVAAAIQVMVNAGLDAPSAIGQLTQVLTRLGDRDTIKRLKDLGVESSGLIGTLRQLAERRIGIDEIIELGIGSKRAAAGVAALTADAANLDAALRAIDGSSGALARVGADLDKLNAEAVERLSASVKSLGTNLGQQAAPSSAFLNGLTAIVNAADRGVTKLREFGGGLSLGEALAKYVVPLAGASVQTKEFVGVLDELNARQATLRGELGATQTAATAASAALATSLGDVASAIGAQIAAADQRIKDLRTSLSALAPDLAATAKQVQDSANTAIAAIAAEAQGRLAALNTLTKTERDNALEAVRIAREASTERLKVIRDTATQVLAAINAEAAARRAVAISTGQELAKVEQQIATTKQTTLAQLTQRYQAYLNELVAQETAHLNKIRDLNTQRQTLNQSIEDRIRDIRRSGLGEYEQYQDKVRQIDENVSKARRALAEGDLKAAEQFAQKAIELTSGIATKVEQDGQTVVSQFSAQETAVAKLKDAQQVLNGVIDERVAAEREGAQATATNAEKARTQLEELKKQLESINSIVAEGVDLKLTADTTAVFDEITKLEAATAERDLLVGLKVKVDEAKAQLVGVKADLEAGLTVEANVRLDKVTAAVQAIREERPELTVQTAQAEQAIGGLRTAIADLGQPVTIEATVDSNVGQVQAAIDELKKPTFSTHTITVQRVEANAAGGVVGDGIARMRRAWPAARQAVQHFARGGAVFRRPGWTKVPGSGNRDTVPAALQAGSFVVRKAASQHYGDGIMRALAGVQHFALGGKVELLPLLQGKISDVIVSSVLASLGGGGASGRKIDGVDVGGLEAKLIAIQEAARGLPRSATGLDIGVWASALLNRIPFMAAAKVKVLADEINKSFQGILSGIDNARAFKVPSVVADDLLGFLFLNRGGRAAKRGTDTVPAMLTPGEFVVRQPRVAQLGEGFMHAVNSMAFSRESLAAMLAGPAAPKVRRYAEGGVVAGSSTAATPRAVPGSTSSVTVNLNASAADLYSAENVRRFLLPVLRDIERTKR